MTRRNFAAIGVIVVLPCLALLGYQIVNSFGRPSMPPPLTLDVLRNESDLPSVLWDYSLDLSNEASDAKKRATGSAFSDLERREFQCTLPRCMWYVVRFFTFDGDMLNGGIQQFFYNHTPREVCETLEVLEVIGATVSAAVLRKAMSVYERKYNWPAALNERWLDGAPDDANDAELNSLTDLRCNDESSGRDYAILDSYLRGHLEECLPPPSVR